MTIQMTAAYRPTVTGLLASAGLLVFTAPVLALDPQLVPLALVMLLVALGLASFAGRWSQPVALGDILRTKSAWVLGAVAVPAGMQLTSVLGPSGAGLRVVVVAVYAFAVAAV